MGKENRFSKNYAGKSTTELQNIVGNSDYQIEAQQAATSELERRKEEEKELATEEEDTSERVTLSTEKKENRLTLLLVMSVLALIFRFASRSDSEPTGRFESIGDLVSILIFVALMVYTIIKSIKKMSLLNESIEISDYSLMIKQDDSTLKFNKQNRPADISRTLNELTITEQNGNEIKVNLENYSLSYSKSKLLTQKVDELRKNWSTE